jgi:FkbM family methyltransferase
MTLVNRSALANFTAGAIRNVLSLPGDQFYRRASSLIERALWHEDAAPATDERKAGHANKDVVGALPSITIRAVDLGGGCIAEMYCIGDMAVFRAKTVLNKEPFTIRWLDRMSDTDVLWDVGANVGAYTVYAAMRRRCRVIAIEPGAANYYLLNKNIELNDLAGRVTALCLAATSSSGFGFLTLPSTEPGKSLSAFAKDPARAHDAGFRQGMVGYTLDDLSGVVQLPAPTFIKVDVDGLEDEIIKGAQTLLRREAVRSVMVERDINKPELIADLTSAMSRCGFRLVEKGVRTDRFPSAVNCIYDR